jgi:hypothetical protein
MKHAAAMKYGGELVAAQDCDYESYLLLGTLCPECKEPVYLKSGGDRVSVKGKPYKIGPHFSHRKGTSEEQIAACETRVSNYTDKDRQRIAAKAKGQRLKLLHRWFWSVVKNKAPDNGETGLESLPHYFDDHYQGPIYFDSKDLDSIALEIKKTIRENSFDEIWNIACKSPLALVGFFSWGDDRDDESEWFLTDRTASITEIDKKITVEVLEYISGKLSRPTLYSLCNATVIALDCFASIMEYDKQERADYAASYLEAIYFWLFHIPWAAEFQRLEAEANERKGNAA